MAAGGGTTLPAPALLAALPSWAAIDFISDLHLSEGMPATFGAFAAHLRHTDADAVFILGDLFELWVGDDARHEMFAARCVALLAEVSRQRTIGVMVGNRDFLMGPALMAACGVTALPDPTLLEAFGRRVVLTHGDALCLDDRAYQAFRNEVRSPQWISRFLARPLAERLAVAREIRQASETRRRFDGDMASDVDPAAALSLLHGAAAEALVHGHTHRPGTETLQDGSVRHVLTDWDLDGASRAGVLRLTARGFERLPPARAC